jgi:Family of unknown function (DUF5317)
MLVSALVAGLVLGLASGGNWRNLAKVNLTLSPALVAGVIARVAAPFLGEVALAASIVGLVLVGVVALVNRALPGSWLIGLGALLNSFVTLVNGGMPVDPGGLILSGKASPADGLHVVLGPDTRLPFLADVLLVPVINNLYSVGDVVLALGGFWMVFRIVRFR